MCYCILGTRLSIACRKLPSSLSALRLCKVSGLAGLLFFARFDDDLLHAIDLAHLKGSPLNPTHLPRTTPDSYLHRCLELLCKPIKGYVERELFVPKTQKSGVHQSGVSMVQRTAKLAPNQTVP